MKQDKSYYISNCFIEAVKAKMHNKNVKIYLCRPRITENGHFQKIHFMWEDEEGSYDFSEPDGKGLCPLKQLLFRGHVRKFEKGFARHYSAYRNRKNMTGGRKWGKTTL